MDAREALQKYFGFGEFRSGQEEIVNTIVSGQDSLVVMPTGGGKSLCYQLPALLLPGATLVISPLIALMKDQVDALRARGIEAETINSSLSPSEQDERIDALAQGRLKLLYVAPERFGQRRFVEALSRAQVSLVAVDEAHCVSQWGHDFRPDYLKIGKAVRQIGNATIAAFTATATPDVRADIVTHLALKEPKIFVTGFARPNLSFRIVNTPSKMDKFQNLHALVDREKTGIIYCATRKKVDEVFKEVQAWGTKAVAYHAGMADESRSSAQERFISRRADVAVATSAFGMGIDRADIRFVAHYEMPGSVEAYYQEAGRAGRDGAPARCDFLYSYADKRVQEFFIEGANPGIEMVRLLWDYLRRNADAQGDVRMSISAIAEALGMKNDMALGSALTVLMRARYADRFDIPGKRIRGTRILRADLTSGELVIDEKALMEKERRDNARLQAVIDFATSGGCRQEWMLHYFGDPAAHACGRCDWCLRAEREGIEKLSEAQVLVLRKALSGVARMSRRVGGSDWEGLYGMGKICDMLCGKEKGPMREHGLNKLSTFGLLADEGADFTRALLEECLLMGLLRKTQDERPVVTLTQLGAAAMRGDHVPLMQWPDGEGKMSKPKKRSAGKKNADNDSWKQVKPRREIDMTGRNAGLGGSYGALLAFPVGTSVPRDIDLFDDPDDLAAAARTEIDAGDEFEGATRFVPRPSAEKSPSLAYKPTTAKAKKKPKHKGSLFDDEPEAKGFDELLAALKKKRMELAQKKNLKAFQIFPNSTLEAMARAKPTTKEEALNVPGIGLHKASHEFPEFVPVIERFL